MWTPFLLVLAKGAERSGASCLVERAWFLPAHLEVMAAFCQVKLCSPPAGETCVDAAVTTVVTDKDA